MNNEKKNWVDTPLTVEDLEGMLAFVNAAIASGAEMVRDLIEENACLKARAEGEILARLAVEEENERLRDLIKK